MDDAQLEQSFIEYVIGNPDIKVSPQQIRQANQICEWATENLFNVILDLQVMNLNTLQETLSHVTGFPHIDPLQEVYWSTFSKATLATVSYKVAIEMRVFPVKIEGGKLHIAMANPTDERLCEWIEKMAGYPLEKYVCYPKNILRAVVRYYSLTEGKKFDELVADALAEIRGEKKIEKPPSIWTEPLSQALRRDIRLFPKGELDVPEGDVAVSMIVSRIIDVAIAQGASDIHMEPFENVVRVRIRTDGILHTEWYVPNEVRNNLINRIKVLSGMDLSSRRGPQDGSIVYENVLPVGVDIRVSLIPTARGDRMVLRLLDKCRGMISPEKLGMEEDDLVKFDKACHSPYGMILMTGPTGSGKTTSIYAALDRLNQEHRCIVTIEDPVEYEMKGINQVEVDYRIKFGFAEALRSILRQNPDVILLGEIRDEESAQVAVNASSTGHLVFSTLHTNDAAGAIPRLLTMGCDPYVLANSIRLIVSQRLLRRLCRQCRRPDFITPERLAKLGLSMEGHEGEKFMKAGHCAECFGHGYSGRIGAFEVLVPDMAVRDMILRREPGLRIHQYAVTRGMRTLRDAALLIASRGLTSLDEVVRVTLEDYSSDA